MSAHRRPHEGAGSLKATRPPADSEAVRPRRPAALAPTRDRPAPPPRPRIVVVGASTGGPKALGTLLGGLAAPFPLPILVAQHMPGPFLTLLAQRLAIDTGHDVRLADQGTLIRPGRVLLAPGDRHMTVRGPAPRASITLQASPPEHYCRPAADPLLRSAADVFGPATLCVVLTGMGEDASAGSRVIVAAGGRVVVQDEATSVVWGMPGAVSRAGLASAAVPIDSMAATLAQICGVVPGGQ